MKKAAIIRNVLVQVKDKALISYDVDVYFFEGLIKVTAGVKTVNGDKTTNVFDYGITALEASEAQQKAQDIARNSISTSSACNVPRGV